MNQYPFSQKQKDSGIAQAIPFHYSGQKKKDLPVLSLPGGALLSHSRTIVAAAALNFCVRDGYRCARRAFSTRFRGSSLKAGRITLSPHSCGQVLGLLVPVRSACRHACTPGLSTS